MSVNEVRKASEEGKLTSSVRGWHNASTYLHRYTIDTVSERKRLKAKKKLCSTLRPSCMFFRVHSPFAHPFETNADARETAFPKTSPTEMKNTKTCSLNLKPNGQTEGQRLRPGIALAFLQVAFGTCQTKCKRCSLEK